MRVESSSFAVVGDTRSQPVLVSPQAGVFTQQREEKGWYLQPPPASLPLGTTLRDAFPPDT